MGQRHRARRIRSAIGAIIAVLVMVSCGGNPGGAPPPQTPTPVPATGGSCSTPLTSAVLTPAAAQPKPPSTDDRRTRRGRVDEELWKHQAAARRRSMPAAIAPAASAEDIGQVAVVRDESDLVLAANPYTFPFYAGRYAEAFVNSDGNVTFCGEEHASSDRNVARFLRTWKATTSKTSATASSAPWVPTPAIRRWTST